MKNIIILVKHPNKEKQQFPVYINKKPGSCGMVVKVMNFYVLFGSVVYHNPICTLVYGFQGQHSWGFNKWIFIII